MEKSLIQKKRVAAFPDFKKDLTVLLAVLVSAQLISHMDIVKLYKAESTRGIISEYSCTGIYSRNGIGKIAARQNENVKKRVNELVHTRSLYSEETALPQMVTELPAEVVDRENAAEIPECEMVQEQEETVWITENHPVTQEKSEAVSEVQVADNANVGLQSETSDAENILDTMMKIGHFEIDENGIIQKCIDPQAASVDQTIVFPTDERCLGIAATALDDIAAVAEVTEVYIPANIRYIEPDAFEKFKNLIYIEVAEDNTVYESIEGILYERTGELVTYPAGREEDA